jgi:hypothetical protein
VTQYVGLGVVILMLLVSARAGAQPRQRRERSVPAEAWSVAASAGIEAMPDSVGGGLDPLFLFGLSGTLRLVGPSCLDVRFGFGSSDDGSETTQVSETRLRFDARPAFCPALHRAVTLVFGAGPAVALGLHEAKVRDDETRYSAFDVGLTGDAAALLRVGPVVFRFDFEAGVIRRFILGTYFAIGVAL